MKLGERIRLNLFPSTSRRKHRTSTQLIFALKLRLKLNLDRRCSSVKGYRFLYFPWTCRFVFERQLKTRASRLAPRTQRPVPLQSCHASSTSLLLPDCSAQEGALLLLVSLR